MRVFLRHAAISCGLLFSVGLAFSASNLSFAQRQTPALVCKPSTLAAVKPRLELSYPCEGQEWDEKTLKQPARVTAIKTLMSQLSSYSDTAWWTADVKDLNVCDFAQKAGRLTPDQRQALVDGDYVSWLFGNERIRLALIPDPCYQPEYGGANAFVLYRNGGRVAVTQVLDGYFSRADNSVGVAFANLNGEEIIEVSTGTGGLNPSLTNYYFTIHPRSQRAVPKNLFRGDHGPTNQVSSAMLFENVPAALEPLKIVRGHSLAKSFNIYAEDEKGKIDDNGRTLSRRILHWNGRLYR